MGIIGSAQHLYFYFSDSFAKSPLFISSCASQGFACYCLAPTVGSSVCAHTQADTHTHTLCSPRKRNVCVPFLLCQPSSGLKRCQSILASNQEIAGRQLGVSPGRDRRLCPPAPKPFPPSFPPSLSPPSKVTLAFVLHHVYSPPQTYANEPACHWPASSIISSPWPCVMQVHPES